MIINQCAEFFQSGGIFMYPLLACSVLLIAAIIYRCIGTRSSSVLPHRLYDALQDYALTGENRGRALNLTDSSSSVLGKLASGIFNSPSNDEETLKATCMAKARHEFVLLQAGIPIMDMIIMVAPMFGILGTASGLVLVFSQFGINDDQGMITEGIARALNTTIAGLAIATPAVIAQSYFSRKLEHYSSLMEVLLTELIHRKIKSDN